MISIAGEVDLFRAAELEAGLARLADRDATLVVVDCSGAAFVDSVVLAVLMRALKRIEAAGGELVIVSDDPRVRRAFEISGLDQVLRIERSLSTVVRLGPTTEPAGDVRAELDELRERNRQLEHALESRIVIEQAKGVLAERLGLDVEAAFDLLRGSARHHGLKIHELAAEVVSSRSTPAPIAAMLERRR